MRRISLLLALTIPGCGLNHFRFNSVLVLPFMNTSGDPADTWLAVGLGETMSLGLTEVRGLFPKPTRSTKYFYQGLAEKGIEPGQYISPAEALRMGRLTKASFVVVGSFERVWYGIKLTACVVRMPGSIIKTVEVVGPYEDLLHLQNRLIQKVAEVIEPEVSNEDLREIERLAKAPGSLEAFKHYSLGLLAYNKGQCEEAERELHEAINLNPDYAEAHFTLGVLHMEGLRLSEARKEFQSAGDLFSGQDILTGMVDARHYNRKVEAFENVFEQVIHGISDSAGFHCDLGILLFDAGAYEEAEEEFREAVNLNPDNHIPRYGLAALSDHNLGILLFVAEDYNVAEEELKDLARLDPDSPLPHFGLWGLYFVQKRYEEADEEWRRYEKLDEEMYSEDSGQIKRSKEPLQK